MTQKRLYLVDDDEAIRHSASFMLRHAGYIVKTYPDGLSFLDEAEKLERGCILLDVRMPGMDGLEVHQTLKTRGIEMPVIILTGHGDVSMAVEAMKNGALDFVEKPYQKQILVDALANAFAQLEHATTRQTREQDAKSRLAVLTKREREVLDRLVDGLTNKGIAEDLSISSRTVEIHRANLMAKLEAESLSAALRTAFDAGIGT